MKKKILRAAAAALLMVICATFAACETAAPYGTFAPDDAEKYKTGVEDAVFAVPEGYTVTMSSNVLAAVGEKDSFSLQCRHSDYVYRNLEKNYKELKLQLTGLYGEYTESKKECTVAGNEALEYRYDLTVAGEEKSYVQYLFYAPKSSALDGERFLLFTYTAPKGEVNEELLSKVVGTVTVKKKGFTPPAGFVTVENAAAKELLSDRYKLYCPDNWKFDTSLGQIVMRVQNGSPTVVFNEIDAKSNLNGYTANYAAENAPALDVSSLGSEERYIAAALYRMADAFVDLELVLVGGGRGRIAKENLASTAAYLQTYTNDAGLTFRYIEFRATMTAFDAHGSYYRAHDYRTEDPQEDLALYRVRQYFLFKNGYIYLFTYTATGETSGGAVQTKDDFSQYLEDALKAVRFFSLA